MIRSCASVSSRRFLHEDFLALPGIVARLGDRLDTLTEHVDALTQRVDALTQQVDALAERIDALTIQVSQMARQMAHMDGRLGSVEGQLYESKYVDNLASRLVFRYRKVHPIVLGNVVQIIRAVDDGRISKQEWDDLVLLDAAAYGRPIGGGDELVVAMELSKTVDVNDVERAARRAAIIRRSGLVVEACVDGEQIEPLAQSRLADLGVFSFVERVAHAG